jgi:hypothetical protein
MYTWNPPDSIKTSLATHKQWAKQREMNSKVDFETAEIEMTIGRKEYILPVNMLGLR